MALARSLKRWLDAGLIEPEQAERIAAFERERVRPALVYSIAALGGLAVAIGVVSIVAANWDEIPAWTKLGVDLAVVAALGLWLVRARESAAGWLRETGVLVLYGLTLASIALIGQTYQLGGDAASALGLWSVLTFILMTRGTSAQLGFAWAAGLQLTYAFCLERIADRKDALEGLTLAAVYWAPLALIAAGGSARLSQARPSYARVFRALGWAELVLVASVGTLAFYERPRPEGALGMWLGVLGSAAASAALCLRRAGTREGSASRWLIIAAFGAAHAGVLLPHGEWPVAAALIFIGLWWVVAWAAHRSGDRTALNLATAAIGLRLIVVYFEVFGSLLDTGLALLSGGVLTLLVVWVWAKKRRELDRQLTGARGTVPPAPGGKEQP